MDEPTSALEQFRQQWREEVNARSRKPDHNRKPSASEQRKARRSGDAVRPERPVNKPPTRHPAADNIKDESDHESDSEGAGGQSSTVAAERLRALSISNVDDDEFSQRPSKEPKSALEHFEHAVERERQGNLGDSLSHYRKAYKLDAKVDQSYKNKHFPVKSTPADPLPSTAPVTVPSSAHPSLKEPTENMTTAQLIETFAQCQIHGTPPVIEGDEPPPCGIKKLPTEVLLELLRHVAIRDPAIYTRLSLVCRKLAYHVYTDNSIWKRVALGSEFGLAGQQYNFSTDIQGRELIFREIEDDDDAKFDGERAPLPTVIEAAFPKETIWRDAFHYHPRIRFTGVYISTVNYTRAGGSSATANTWTNAIHIVTYYRYLRFFRDGTCISLLTTNEPIEVVHHLTRENLAFARAGNKDKASSHPPNFVSSTHVGQRDLGSVHSTTTGGTAASGAAPPPSTRDVMKHALRGRWRLCQPSLDSPIDASSSAAAASGINSDQTRLAAQHPTTPEMTPDYLHIETEGAGPRYMYTMHLSLKSAGSARSKHTTKNNKLVWKGFWSYNLLTNDWAEFHLKNDKPFYFSRVKGYGLGY